MTTKTRPFEILLAEDSPADAQLVREALKEHDINCSLRAISDGAQAIEFINRMDTDPEAPPLDLVLLDIRLPKRDGGEILKHLRCTEHYARTPAILMTGLSSCFVQEEASRDHTIMYFEKPSTLDEFMQLGSIIRRVLERGIASPAHQKNCECAACCGDVA